MIPGFYNMLCNRQEYQSPKLRQCIESTVYKLEEHNTDLNRPGMLLGKIQSGKTRTFIGVMALAFDRGYDVTIILTKGTKALAQQTYQRMKKEFAFFDDQVQFFDIMINLPEKLSKYELNQKMILVVKKQKDNLSKLQKMLFETYPELSNKKILIVDDEADYASIGFSKDKNERIAIRTIAGQIDSIREQLSKCSFLQVTATPYSLYLQPEDISITSETFQPIKPAFTELTPVPAEYIGGNYYFNQTDDENPLSSHLYVEIPIDELRIMRKPDRRSFKIEEALISNKIEYLRRAIVSFVVGGCTRRLQSRHDGEYEKKYSFIVHTEQGKLAHEWQEEIVSELTERLTEAAMRSDNIFRQLISQTYQYLLESLQISGNYVPTINEVFSEVRVALRDGYLVIARVNSDKDVNELLDDSGQLKLRTPLNIFIGGQILDRGITIGNLIGFYYGRSPKTYQQDTVLQHSRMYGYRPLSDLAVTRFYTTIDIYTAMQKMDEFDSALREAFENGSHDSGVVFIQRDEKNKIIPCSPNKIMLSSTTTLKPGKRLLPVGFQTDYKSNIKKTIDALDKLIYQSMTQRDIESPDYDYAFLVTIQEVKDIIAKIDTTLLFEEGYSWDCRAFLASLEYLSHNSPDDNLRGNVWVVVRRNRQTARFKKDGRFENSPDTARQKLAELKIARDAAVNIPAVILLRQNGAEEDGWRGSPFWWPVFVTPQNMRPVVFSASSIDVD